MIGFDVLRIQEVDVVVEQSVHDIEWLVAVDGVYENYRGGFDIILMDIQMRFMDGMTTAEKIRQMDQKVIIMFITNMIQYAVRGYEVDAMDYVVKPVVRTVTMLLIHDLVEIDAGDTYAYDEEGIKLFFRSIFYIFYRFRKGIYHLDKSFLSA